MKAKYFALALSTFLMGQGSIYANQCPTLPAGWKEGDPPPLNWRFDKTEDIYIPDNAIWQLDRVRIWQDAQIPSIKCIYRDPKIPNSKARFYWDTHANCDFEGLDIPLTKSEKRMGKQCILGVTEPSCTYTCE